MEEREAQDVQNRRNCIGVTRGASVSVSVKTPHKNLIVTHFGGFVDVNHRRPSGLAGNLLVVVARVVS